MFIHEPHRLTTERRYQECAPKSRAVYSCCACNRLFDRLYYNTSTTTTSCITAAAADDDVADAAT